MRERTTLTPQSVCECEGVDTSNLPKRLAKLYTTFRQEDVECFPAQAQLVHPHPRQGWSVELVAISRMLSLHHLTRVEIWF